MRNNAIRVRTTDGIDWVKKFRNVNDSKLLFYLMQFEDEITEDIKFPTHRILDCSQALKISPNTIRLHLKYLVECGFLRITDRNTYIVNPNMLSVGSMESFRRKMKHWNNF